MLLMQKKRLFVRLQFEMELKSNSFITNGSKNFKNYQGCLFSGAASFFTRFCRPNFLSSKNLYG
jgi:hypothetical protein